MSLDTISIVGLAVDCIVGINPEERLREQPLRVDLDLRLDLRTAGRTGRFSATCDYDRVSREVAAFLRFRQHRLLEMAAEELSAMLLGLHRQVHSLQLRLTKPRALEGRAEAAAIEVERHASDFAIHHEDSEFGKVDILLETREAGLYLLHVGPGLAIPRHHHRRMSELEWLVSGELLRNGEAMAGWQPAHWPLGAVHDYRNPGSAPATLFCCDVPPFDPSDEVLGAPEALVSSGTQAT